jgi:DNA-binding response OmpR family regulator
MIKRILVVAPDTVAQTGLVSELERVGIATQVCESSLVDDKAASWLPGLIIVDGKLPGKTSLQVCRNLRKSPMYDSVPLVILSDVMNRRTMSAAYQAGADYFVLNQGEDRRALLLTVEAVFNMKFQDKVYQAQ